MQKHVPPRRTGALVWLVCLGALAGCQVLFGVDADDLPAQDKKGSGAGGRAGQGGTGGNGGSGGAPPCNTCSEVAGGEEASQVCRDNTAPTSQDLLSAVFACTCTTCGASCEETCGPDNSPPSLACSACQQESCWARIRDCLDDTPASRAGGGAGGAGGAGGGGNLSLYDRLGGKMGLRGFVTGEVNKVLGVPAFASYFGAQVATPIPQGSPSKAQLIECFARLLAAAWCGAETYPGAPVNDPYNTNTVNFTCRDMATSHANLRINGDTFDAFVTVLKTDIASVVKVVTDTPNEPLELTAVEVATIAGALDGTKTAVVDESYVNDGTGPDPQPPDPTP